MSELEPLVLETIAKHARRPVVDIGPATTLEELAIDSLDFLLCLLTIQSTVGREILNVEKVGNIKTVEDILSLARA